MDAEASRGGGPATAKTESLTKAAEELAPHLSLARVESTAKLLLGSVAVVGSVLTAFGLLGSSALAEHPGYAVPSLVCAAICLVLATLAALGSKDEVQIDDLNDVERYYSNQISKRARMVRWAGLTLSLAIVLALLPAIYAATENGDDSSTEVGPKMGRGATPVVTISVDDDLLRRANLGKDPVDLRVEPAHRVEIVP